MIPVDRKKLYKAEPQAFDRQCRKKGAAWLAKNPKATRKQPRVRDLWSPFRMHLAAAFDDRCGYGAMYEPSGTVDHATPVTANEALAYEWRNYRYVSGWINSAKNKSAQVLDPCSVKAGWFKILLPSLQLVAVEANIPATYRRRAVNTVKDLHLAHDERILRQRREWLYQYESGGLTLAALRRFAPLIAQAVEERDAAASATEAAGVPPQITPAPEGRA